MAYKVIEHISDLQMKIEADTLQDLFVEAMQGMMAMVKLKIEFAAPKIKREISLKSPDRTALLIDFLNEVLALSQSNKEVYDDISFKKFDETSLEAEIRGFKVLEFDEDIKAVTYHEADVRENSKGVWKTNLVFDI